MRFLKSLSITLVLTLALAACAQPTPQASPTDAPAEEVALDEAVAAELFIFSNSSPHVSVIDTETNQVVRTTDIPELTSWTWNDDNNYFDGQNLWLGMKNPDTNDVEVIALNLDTLEVTASIPIGTEELTLYIGKAAQNGVLHVGKMASGQVVTIDTNTFQVLDTWDVPVGEGGVVCDADISIGPDGVERFYYPTRASDMLVSISPETGEVLEMVDTPEGSTPLMLTTAPDGTVWVQEVASNTNAVFDPVNLNLIGRFATGKSPIVASFSADGAYGFIGHGGDTVVTVIDTTTLQEIERIFVGANPQKLAVHPSGEFLYAIVTKEASVAVIHTGFWGVTERIDLGTDPTGIFIRAGS